MTFFAVASAYQRIRTFEVDTTCITFTGSSTGVTPAFSILSADTTNPSSFQSSAASQFITFLGLNGCGVGNSATVLLTNNGSAATINVAPSTTSTDVQSAVPGTLTQTSLSLSLPLLTATVTAPVQTVSNPTPSSSPPSSSILPTHTKVAIGVAILVLVLALLLTVSFLYHRRRKNQRSANANANAATSQDGDPKERSQPFLQQKAELEAKENRKHELEAVERKHEMGTEGERHELSAEEDQKESRRRPEL